MNIAGYAWRRALYGVPLVLGVTLVSFLLMVEFGPDRTYELLGKNPTAAEVAEVRRSLGYDRPFAARYIDYLGQLVTLDLGRSDATGESVRALLARTVPVSLALVLPGFILGNLAGIVLGTWAADRRGRWPDRLVLAGSVLGMSLSMLVATILLQILLCTPYGLNLFPARGWDASSLGAWLHHVTVPTLALATVTVGYNTRFYRAVMAEELGREHVLAARAAGLPRREILFRRVLRNAAVPITTRLLFSIPVIVVTGSVVLESVFGIPGLGKASWDAILGGDQPVLKAVVALTAIAFVVLQFVADLAVRWFDPRVGET